MFDYKKWEKTAPRFLPQIIQKEGLKDRKILVTGASGLIGSSVIDLLVYLNEKENYGIEVYAAVRNLHAAQQRFRDFIGRHYFHFVPYDAEQTVTFEFKVDFIIQAASAADPVAISSHPAEALMSNVYGLHQMLEYGKRIRAKRILFLSSSEIYGTNVTGKPFREHDYGIIDLLNPRASYPMGKRAAETLCASYAKEYGMDVVIVRPGHIYGPCITQNDSRVSAEFTRRASSGEAIVLKSEGKQLRSYCYVYDCATAILTVLLNGCNATAYNISNKDSIISIRDLADIFAASGNCPLSFEIPSEAEKAGYNLMSISALDASRLEGLGWRAVADAEDGIKMTLDLYENAFGG